MVHLDATLAALQRRRKRAGVAERSSSRSSRKALFNDFYEATSPVPPPKMTTESCSPGRRVLLYPQRRRRQSHSSPKTPLRLSELLPPTSNSKQLKSTLTLAVNLRKFEIRVTEFPLMEDIRNPYNRGHAGMPTAHQGEDQGERENGTDALGEEDEDDLFIVSMPQGSLRRFGVRPYCFPGDPFIRALKRFSVDVKSFPVSNRSSTPPLKRFSVQVDQFPVKPDPPVSSMTEESISKQAEEVEEDSSALQRSSSTSTENDAGSGACFLNTKEVLDTLESKPPVRKLQPFAVNPTRFPVVAPCRSLVRFRVDPNAFPWPVNLHQPQLNLNRFQVNPTRFPRRATTQKLSSFSVPPWQFPIGSTAFNKLRAFTVAPDVFPAHEWEHIKGLKTRWRALLKPTEAKEEAVDFGSRVTVHMKGSTLGGKNVFWDTKDVGESAYSFSAGVGKIVKGLDAAIIGMKVGEVRHVKVASEEGYGKAGFPQWGIRANEDLDFEVELLSIG